MSDLNYFDDVVVADIAPFNGSCNILLIASAEKIC
jgi:hypothetical protein